jgi:hypothetical protein
LLELRQTRNSRAEWRFKRLSNAGRLKSQEEQNLVPGLLIPRAVSDRRFVNRHGGY